MYRHDLLYNHVKGSRPEFCAVRTGPVKSIRRDLTASVHLQRVVKTRNLPL